MHGTVYQLPGMTVGYKPLKKFIEGGFLDHANYHMKFNTPQILLNKWTLPFKQSWEVVYKQVIEKGLYRKVMVFLMSLKLG